MLKTAVVIQLFLCVLAVKSGDVPKNTPERWLNPCSRVKTVSVGELDPLLNITKTPYSWYSVLNTFLLSVDKAIDSFKVFRNKYIQETGQKDFLQRDYSQYQYDWLPKLRKQPGQPTPHDHLEDRKLDDFAKEWLRAVQTLHVGLERVFWDLAVEADESNTKYKDVISDVWATSDRMLAELLQQMTDLGVESISGFSCLVARSDEIKCVQVLCETKAFATNINANTYPDVTREGKNFEIPNVGPVALPGIRDWLIFRSYLNLLEYMKESLTFLLEDGKTELWFNSRYQRD